LWGGWGSAVTRRTALLGLATAATLGPVRLAFAQAPTQKRFVVVILRGALDGLAAVVPHGDRFLAQWRPELIPAPDSPDALLDLGGFYGMPKELAGLHAMYVAGECLPVHAVSGNYRTRSHFEAQDFLECGTDHRLDSGWLNRALACLPPRTTSAGEALAMGPAVPLLLRGPTMVGNWSPDDSPLPSPDLYARIAALNEPDHVTGAAIAEGLRARGFTASALGVAQSKPGPAENRFAVLATAAGKFLSAEDGPRIAAMELGGWDTHADQMGRLRNPLKQLDGGLVALKSALGESWKQTVVLVMTEFGRTVRMNGTKGTDHGTGGVAFVLGGGVAGGRVGGTWPGLAQSALFENRDLAPTTDLRSVAQGILVAHLGIAKNRLDSVFPGASGVMRGILKA
jgi:uncharacterized protein (DUF1501 family)